MGRIGSGSRWDCLPASGGGTNRAGRSAARSEAGCPAFPSLEGTRPVVAEDRRLPPCAPCSARGARGAKDHRRRRRSEPKAAGGAGGGLAGIGRSAPGASSGETAGSSVLGADPAGEVDPGDVASADPSPESTDAAASSSGEGGRPGGGSGPGGSSRRGSRRAADPGSHPTTTFGLASTARMSPAAGLAGSAARFGLRAVRVGKTGEKPGRTAHGVAPAQGASGPGGRTGPSRIARARTSAPRYGGSSIPARVGLAAHAAGRPAQPCFANRPYGEPCVAPPLDVPVFPGWWIRTASPRRRTMRTQRPAACRCGAVGATIGLR